MEVFGDFGISPGNGIMEGWNDGILVFKRILTILILSSLPPVAEPSRKKSEIPSCPCLRRGRLCKGRHPELFENTG
jgi:hypothetical protein